MKKATLVSATIVAFLLSGPVYAARKTVTDIPTVQTIFMGPGIPTSTGGVLTVPGPSIGEYIPAPTNKGISIIPKTTVPISKIGTLAKGIARGGIAGIAIGYAWDEMMDGLDWVMQDGQVVKKTPGGDLVYEPNGDYFYWQVGTGVKTSSPYSSCPSTIDYDAFNKNLPLSGVRVINAESATCMYTRYSPGDTEGSVSVRRGNQCPAGSSNDPATGTCKTTGALAPISNTDLGLLDDFILGKDGVWQRDLTNQLCNGAASCYQALEPSTSLTGPGTVSGVPSTVTTTSPSGSTTVSTQTPTTTITYGPNYYDYNTTTTTTTNNGGQTTTTTDDTDISMPVPPNIFGGANGGLGGIKDGIPTESSSISPLPYMPWWSFSQSCTEVTFVLPVYGDVTTKNCPIYEKYIWPVLYFIFAVFTWLTCWSIWRNTVLHVRAS